MGMDNHFPTGLIVVACLIEALLSTLLYTLSSTALRWKLQDDNGNTRPLRWTAWVINESKFLREEGTRLAEHTGIILKQQQMSHCQRRNSLVMHPNC